MYFNKKGEVILNEIQRNKKMELLVAFIINQPK